MVVPYIGTWIETLPLALPPLRQVVVPYIGTWIETLLLSPNRGIMVVILSEYVVPYIGTWIETGALP